MTPLFFACGLIHFTNCKHNHNHISYMLLFVTRKKIGNEAPCDVSHCHDCNVSFLIITSNHQKAHLGWCSSGLETYTNKQSPPNFVGGLVLNWFLQMPQNLKNTWIGTQQLNLIRFPRIIFFAQMDAIDAIVPRWEFMISPSRPCYLQWKKQCLILGSFYHRWILEKTKPN